MPDFSKLTVADMHAVAQFHRIVKNYIKIKKLLDSKK